MQRQSEEDTSRSINVRPFRGRQIGGPKRLFVYRNLHQACWSVRAMDGPDRGRVVGHADSIALYECTFKVNEAGRQRVLREGRKNVHAGVVGTLAPDHDWINGGLDVWVRYNPYESGAFLADGVAPVVSATHVHLGTDGRVRASGCQRAGV